MKQRITIDQLNELSQPARQKLRKYILKEWSEPMKDQKGNWIHAETTLDEYLLSIGQMIEFLDENRVYLEISRVEDEQTGEYRWSASEIWVDGMYFEAIELCDALWEAVKERLEK